MTELDLFYWGIPYIAGIVVDLREKTAEEQEQFKRECMERADNAGVFVHSFICKVLIVIDRYLKNAE